MTAFDMARRIEVAGMADLLPFLRGQACDGQFVLTNKGNLSEFLQKTVGDALLNCNQGKVWGVEIKTEATNKHGNFFLETWSNRTHGMQTAGWMYTLRADILLYHFLAEREVYSIPFAKLWHWAFVRRGNPSLCGRIYDFPERPQGKYDQKNLTAGRCVPIATIRKEIGFRHYSLFDSPPYFQEIFNGVEAGPLFGAPEF